MNWNSIYKLIENAALYLSQHPECEEDRVPHNGRRAYAWTLLRWLAQHKDSCSEWPSLSLKVANEILPAIRENKTGATVVFPGLDARRNYSTNAIDCGIFVDAFYDFAAVLPGEARPWEPRVAEIAETYLARKLSTRPRIHNQYLWAATGLARWSLANKDKDQTLVYRSLLAKAIEEWLQFNGPDGFSPYMTSGDVPYLNGISTYYHSRCLAFTWYVMQCLCIECNEVESRLLKGAYFLASMQRRDGVKQIALESKRYYFSGTHEVGSHPYDIYVYSKAHSLDGESLWLELASSALRKLVEAQLVSGAIPGQSTGPHFDWQCHTMRTGHLAWLTRTREEFIKSCLRPKTESSFRTVICNRADNDNLILIGNESGWTHFLSKKAPLVGHAGSAVTGLILYDNRNMNDISQPFPLHYRVRGKATPTIRRFSYFKVTLHHAIRHSLDCIFYKRQPFQAWAILRLNLFTFLWVALTTRSTEFCCHIRTLIVEKNQIHHELTLADVFGSQEQFLGNRRIRWRGPHVEVTDEIRNPFPLPVRVPIGWACSGNVSQQANGTVMVGPGTVHYEGDLSGSLN